jgi:hypothetical protein
MDDDRQVGGTQIRGPARPCLRHGRSGRGSRPPPRYPGARARVAACSPPAHPGRFRCRTAVCAPAHRARRSPAPRSRVRRAARRTFRPEVEHRCRHPRFRADYRVSRWTIVDQQHVDHVVHQHRDRQCINRLEWDLLDLGHRETDQAPRRWPDAHARDGRRQSATLDGWEAFARGHEAKVQPALARGTAVVRTGRVGWPVSRLPRQSRRWGQGCGGA